MTVRKGVSSEGSWVGVQVSSGHPLVPVGSGEHCEMAEGRGAMVRWAQRGKRIPPNHPRPHYSGRGQLGQTKRKPRHQKPRAIQGIGLPNNDTP